MWLAVSNTIPDYALHKAWQSLANACYSLSRYSLWVWRWLYNYHRVYHRITPRLSLPLSFISLHSPACPLSPHFALARPHLLRRHAPAHKALLRSPRFLLFLSLFPLRPATRSYLSRSHQICFHYSSIQDHKVSWFNIFDITFHSSFITCLDLLQDVM